MWLTKNIHPGIALLVVLIFTLLLVSGVSYVHAQPSSVTIQTTASATTTVAYIGNGTATSTYQFDNATFSSGKIANLQSIDSASLYLQVAASSTATQYTVTPQVSNNNVDWYGIGAQGTPSAAGVVAVSTSTGFTWTPGTTATSSMVFNLPIVPTMHERVVVSASGGAGSAYMEVDLKKSPSNP